MKVMTVLGTRPEIIRLSRIIPLLDQHCEHVLVHTGQNFDDRLSGLFFRELEVRQPDVALEAQGAGFGAQVGQILGRLEPVLRERRPDRLLILGDTNSGLSALLARRLGIPVYHMEAGNRCYDDRVPEEVNRRAIDHASSILMPYTERSRENLLREGIASERILVTGNPIHEVMEHHAAAIAGSTVLADLGVEAGGYFLLTAHRAENVDQRSRLADLVDAMARLHERWNRPVICSLHPRTRDKAQAHGITLERPGVRFLPPLGFLDFVRLEQSAACVLSDSGTVQEETCLLGVRNVTIREVTERPETVECGSNVLAGTAPAAIERAVAYVLSRPATWQPPAGYRVANVSDTVARIVLGFRSPDAAEREWQAQARP